MQDDDKLDQSLINAINSAVTSQLKRNLSNIQTTILDEVGNLLDTKLSSFQPATAPKEKEEAQPANELESKLKALQDRLEKSEKLRLETEHKSRMASVEMKIKDAIKDKVPSGLIPVATQHLMKVENRITFDDEGNARFRFGEDDLDLDSGLKSYIKSKDFDCFRSTKREPSATQSELAFLRDDLPVSSGSAEQEDLGKLVAKLDPSFLDMLNS